MSGPAVGLAGLACRLPAHRFAQGELKAAAAQLFAGRVPELEGRLRIFDRAGVQSRHLALPLAWYLRKADARERELRFLKEGERLAREAGAEALRRAGVAPSQVDLVISVTSTGALTPSLDAHVAERMGLRPDVARLPVHGLGCAGGVLGLARAAALARGGAGTCLLLVVELCSLALRPADASLTNLVACALFADGAGAAVVAAGGGAVRIAAWGEARVPGSLEVMGFAAERDGLKIMLSPAIPELVRRHLRPSAERFLARHGLALADIDRLAIHPGGPKVLEAVAEGMGAPASDLALAARVLERFGNVSAVSILLVLERLLADPDWGRALAVAMGPGFTIGFVLLER